MFIEDVSKRAFACHSAGSPHSIQSTAAVPPFSPTGFTLTFLYRVVRPDVWHILIKSWSCKYKHESVLLSPF